MPRPYRLSPKWRVLLLLALAQLLAMSLWFSATAVTPALVEEWQLSPGSAASPSEWTSYIEKNKVYFETGEERVVAQGRG